MVTTWIIAKKSGYAPISPTFRRRASSTGFRECFWALIFPVFLLVGFRFGFFTATEAGAFLVVYALVIGTFVYREMTWKTCRGLKVDGRRHRHGDAAHHHGGGARPRPDHRARPAAITGFLTSLTTQPSMLLTLLVLLLFVTGMVLEAPSTSC